MKLNIRNRYNQIVNLTQGTILESDKTQEIITYKRAKGPACSQLVATRLQGVNKTAWKIQTNTNNKKVSTKEAQPWNGQ